MTPLLQIKCLTKEFIRSKREVLPAVNDVSLEIYKGETLGLMGESGCGKSTLAKCLLMLDQPTKGEVLFENNNVLKMSKAELFHFRRNAQMIFQDPTGALNPKMTIENLLAEPLRIHRICKKEEELVELHRLLDVVGLSKHMLDRYPHEFSGGQKQRVVIARALALKPSFLVCDEPLSALDISIQGQIVNLLKDLQKEFHLTYLFISHDLSMVQYMSDRILRMHQGQLIKENRQYEALQF